MRVLKKVSLLRKETFEADFPNKIVDLVNLKHYDSVLR